MNPNLASDGRREPVTHDIGRLLEPIGAEEQVV